jgi:hypothetical protein
MSIPQGGSDREGGRATPKDLPALNDDTEKIARRLFSCPACGSHWVVFGVEGVHVIGVRTAAEGDPPGVVLRCEYCLASVDADGSVAPTLRHD